LSETAVELPKKLRFLFEPHRLKVAYGGRGSGKSWSFATALLVMGTQEQTRIICAREVQKSIKESVHRLLSDRIRDLNLSSFYEVLETEIRGKNGTTFSFSGLSQHTVDSIKSFEGADICWVEEGQSVSKKSWDVLTPTIRRPGSEIWVSLNPELDTDETYKRFIVNKPDHCMAVEVNWQDNPWFGEVLELERQHCLAASPDDYPTIWEGKCRSAVVGAIYAKEIDTAQREQRVCFIPYDPKLKVHTVWDLGWNDSMTVSFVQRVRSELRVIDYIEDSHRTLDSYVAEIKERRYNWGFDFLPHDGYHKDFKSGKSAEQILKAFGRTVKPVPNESIENGIKSGRMALGQAVFNKGKTDRLVECLKRYRRSVNSTTNEPGAPLHDEYSHGADNWRYLSLCADMMTNDDERPHIHITPFEAFDPEFGT
jgi:phage terminase large subunit